MEFFKKIRPSQHVNYTDLKPENVIKNIKNWESNLNGEIWPK